MATLEIFRRVSGPYNLNTYFLVCTRTRETMVIDPGSPAGELVDFINDHHLKPVRILHTHGHADQFFSTEAFKRVFPIPSCLHTADDLFFQDPDVRKTTRKAVGLPSPYPADIRLEHGDRICFGDTQLTIIHTPGHTPGSACFLCEGHLFAGDTVFVGEVGRTDLPGGDLDQLMASIKRRILTLNKQTIILPGHYHTGDPIRTTIEKEMKENIYITDFILDD